VADRRRVADRGPAGAGAGRSGAVAACSRWAADRRLLGVLPAWPQRAWACGRRGVGGGCGHARGRRARPGGTSRRRGRCRLLRMCCCSTRRAAIIRGEPGWRCTSARSWACPQWASPIARCSPGGSGPKTVAVTPARCCSGTPWSVAGCGRVPGFARWSCIRDGGSISLPQSTSWPAPPGSAALPSHCAARGASPAQPAALPKVGESASRSSGSSSAPTLDGLFAAWRERQGPTGRTTRPA
jgi:hypothetical protein